MKILVAGDWHSELHEEAISVAFSKLGHEVIRFSWHQYFKPSFHQSLIPGLDLMLKKAQNKYLMGPLISKINRDLIETARFAKPDMIFIYRGTHIRPSTLLTMKMQSPSAVIFGLNNDDPFSPLFPSWMWRHFIKGIPIYDIVLAYRLHNISEFLRAGANRVELLRSWFIPGRNYPTELSAEEKNQYECDVVFAGHYEDDGRVDFLEEVVKQGWRLKLYGPGYDWDPVISKSISLSSLVPVRLVWGDEYNKALSGGKIALCFLSKLNRDTYTRRCFEIPATGSLMLSEYTDDLASLFQEGTEVDYFRSLDEFVLKISRYLGDEELRRRVAAAGHRAVVNNNHDVVSRARQVTDWAEQIRGTNEK